MAAIIQKWRKTIGIGCTHGELANKGLQKQVLDFCKDYKPELRFELGDLVDTAAFRSGARGTVDEATKIEPDEFAALSWLERYHPTHVLFGNHCDRLRQLQDSPNAIVSYAASKLWTQLNDTVRRLKAKSKNYDIMTGVIEVGGVFWTHGYMFSENAVRDHAEFYGGPVVMAHLHAAQEVRGRTFRPTKSFCVGTLAEVEAMGYARRRRATARWSAGIVYGEVSDKSSRLWLSTTDEDGKFQFPFSDKR